MAYLSPNGRTVQNLAHEFEAVLLTVAERKRRMPQTDAGAGFAARMAEIAAGAAASCLQADGVTLVATPEELDAAEVALENARQALAATVDEFLGLDIVRAQVAPREATPQVIMAEISERQAQAPAAEAGPPQ